MKVAILFLIATAVSLSVFSQNTKSQKFYVGTYTSAGAKGIYLCSFDSENGEITQEKSFSGIENPSFVRLSPDKKYLYSVSEAGDKGSFVYAYKREKNGDLIFLNKQSSNGNGPCHVDVSEDGKFVAVANYGGGTTSLYPVANNGALNEATTININKGNAQNENRQSKPHAHSIKFSPFDNQVFSTDLGTDHLDIFQLENNELKKGGQSEVVMVSGAGPRHFDFHPNKEVLYVINELNSTVAVVKREDNVWLVKQNISTLPENFEGKSYCADIHISKDGKYLYGSNRGHNSIVVYKVNKKDQSLKNLGTVSVEGDWPRNFALTPDGNWMLVANQKSKDITVFKMNGKTGMPEFSGKKYSLPSPVCVEFL